MDRREIERLINSDREWRAFLIEKINKIEDRLSTHMAWNLVFRVVGSSLFAIALVWFEYRFNRIN